MAKMKDVLLTYGPTRGYLDAMRFLTNQSTGRLGALLVSKLAQAGFRVYALQGKGAIRPRIPGACKDLVTLVEVDTVSSVLEESEGYLSHASPFAVIHAMAVLDYEPAMTENRKVPSGRAEWTVRLKPTPKVIQYLRRCAPNSRLISFKLEKGLDETSLAARALASLKRSQSDLVVANDLSSIKGSRHPALLVDPKGTILARPRTKTEIASALVDYLG